MNDYPFTLEPYKGMKTRYRCPNCQKNGIFTRYIDKQTEEYITDTVGKCGRIIKCGYHYPPKQYFEDYSITDRPVNRIKTVTVQPIRNKINLIPERLLDKSIKSDASNFFIDYLTHLWSREVALYLADKYYIGTSTHWKGATVFWQIDKTGRIRSGKLMLYNPKTGKRRKKYNNWVHSIMKFENFNLKQCLFGEHLLKTDTAKPVAIVESEKTAVIASVLLPDYIWLACGSVNNLSKEKTVSLKNRDVILYPDLKCYDLWQAKLPELNHFASCQISKLLEEKASLTEKEDGLDIADYLVKFIE